MKHLVACAAIFSLGASLSAQSVKLLEGARIIDGSGRPPMEDTAILIDGERIAQVGRRGDIKVASNAQRIDFTGKTIVPGYIDLHFHLANDPPLVAPFLAAGVTYARDPGEWIERYEPIRAWIRANNMPGPRLSLAGPALDGQNPAHPTHVAVVLSPEDARKWVRTSMEMGADVIKVYYRLPLDSIRAAAEEAHRFGVPVTCHLEVVDARSAVEAGVDGIEHITSLGLNLIPPQQAERYRQAVLKDNDARGPGRNEMWASIDPHGKPALELAQFLARRRIFVTPTLAVFEQRADPAKPESEKGARAWRNMRDYAGVLQRAGVPLVVGSHTKTPFSKRGMAYHRELEALVEGGLTPMEALVAAGRNGARFLRRDDVGEIANGKLADLVVLDANPLDDIRNASKVHRVIMNGRILDPAAIPPLTMSK